MGRRVSNFRRQMRGRTKTLGVLAIMVLIVLGAKLRELLGIESVQDLDDLANATVEAVVAFALIGFPLYLFYRFFFPKKKRKVWIGDRSVGGSKGIRWPEEHRMPARLRPIFEYWRQSIIDSQRMDLSIRDFEDFGSAIPWQGINSGNADPDLVEVLRQRSQEMGETSRPKNVPGNEKFANSEVGVIEILIAPLSFRKAASTGIEDSALPRLLIPFWVPAGLLPNGELVPPRNAYPWIPRVYLEPVVRDSAIVVGDVDDLERFVALRLYPRGGSWQGYWKYCEELFRSVCGSPLSEFTLEGYERRPSGTVLMDTTAIGGTNRVERLYNDILEGRCAIGAAGTLAELHPPKRRTVKDNPRDTLHHHAQFGSAFPLSPSQRTAVHQTLRLKKGEILAVTGPPGTGKTTFIQSIVASMWAANARLGRPYPPLIVSCSATNQATMNVIDCFSNVVSTEGALAGRWLPEFSSYGTFCSSFTKSKEVVGIPFTLTDGTGTLSEVERQEYIEEAKRYYLERFGQAYFAVKSIPKALAHLRKEMQREHANLYREFFKAQQRKPGWWNPFASSGPMDGPLQERLEQFDTTYRHRTFQLATHYWEGRWLVEAPQLVAQLRASQGRPRLEKRDWQIRAMITPCFVSTFSMSPQFFGGYAARLAPPIDLLIADEASQVTPEVAAATFALADKGLVIGDPAQLEPVWSVPRHADHGNVIRAGLAKSGDQRRISKLENLGVLASSGSLMNRALCVCAVAMPNGTGIFLSEQRRSVPAIVAFSNALSYGGLLKAKRKELSVRSFPAFGYAHVRGFCSASGKSRLNRPEAESIAQWLNTHRTLIEETYSAPIYNVIAVITPFTAQMRYLRKLLHPRYPAMTIGTANALQGAERPIVIFSPVYDQSQSRERVFDRRPNMLNVAVSRAKDSFLVFGDMGIFGVEGSLPSSVLARFLFADPANELTEIEPYPIVEVAESSIRRISTLDEHREILLRALRSAQREVLIVSPTISQFAIEFDRLDHEIRDACARGVHVAVYTDNLLDFDRETNKVREPAEAGRATIVGAGAELLITDRIHNKTLVTDDHEIVEGSFNWLSAVRKAGSQHQKYEVSYQYSGNDAKRLIRLCRDELSQRVITSSRK